MSEIAKGYKKTEIGVIPEDWEVRELGEIGETIIGLTYKPENIKERGILVLRSSNVGESGLKYNDNVYVNLEVNERLIVIKNDILICVRNGSRNLIGKCALIDEKIAGQTFGAFMSVFRSKYNNYVFYQFKSFLIKKQIDENMGATINQITNKNLNSFKIPLPPLQEQKAIAEALSDVDSLILSLEKLIYKKKKIKEGAMQELLTGKKRLEGFSGEWEVKRLGEIGKCKSGNGFPTNYQNLDFQDYPFFKVSDMNNDGNEIFMSNANNYISSNIRNILGANIFEKDTIVFAKIGAAIFLERKKILTKDSCLDNNMMGFSVNKTINSIKFIYYILKTIKFGNYVNMTALPSLSGKDIEEIEIILPPTKEEQTAIAEILSDIDSEISSLETKLEKYKQIKQGMMQELLTGRIRLV